MKKAGRQARKCEGISERMQEKTRENNTGRQARKGEGMPEGIPEKVKEYREKMVKKGKGWARNRREKVARMGQSIRL
jgi:hypothetical protein